MNEMSNSIMPDVQINLLPSEQITQGRVMIGGQPEPQVNPTLATQPTPASNVTSFEALCGTGRS
jgi:hypothetical protein